MEQGKNSLPEPNFTRLISLGQNEVFIAVDMAPISEIYSKRTYLVILKGPLQTLRRIESGKLKLQRRHLCFLDEKFGNLILSKCRPKLLSAIQNKVLCVLVSQ